MLNIRVPQRHPFRRDFQQPARRGVFMSASVDARNVWVLFCLTPIGRVLIAPVVSVPFSEPTHCQRNAHRLRSPLARSATPPPRIRFADKVRPAIPDPLRQFCLLRTEVRPDSIAASPTRGSHGFVLPSHPLHAGGPATFPRWHGPWSAASSPLQSYLLPLTAGGPLPPNSREAPVPRPTPRCRGHPERTEVLRGRTELSHLSRD